MKARLIATASAVALTALSMPARAQDAGTQTAQTVAGGSVIEEVIVTATRRSERLQDVPLAISAFSQEELTAKGIVGYEGLALETPGVILNKASANFNNFTARGIAINGYNANLQSTVAIYIDELPISANGNSTILNPNLFDVERIEFLRGPQGTLFGSGSLAGAVRILNKSPDLKKSDMAAQAEFGLTGSDSFRQRYNGMFNTPLVEDKLGLRVVGFYRHEEGYLDNVGTGKHNTNTLEDWGGRAIMLWEPTDDLSVRFLTSFEDSEPKDSSLIAPALGREKRRSDRPDLFTAELETYNATINYDMDFAKLTSSTTYADFDQLFVVDLAGTFNQAIAFALDAYAYDKIFVEETRLASNPGGNFDWVIGGFYYWKRRDVDYNYRSTPAFLAARGITGLADEYYQRFGSHFLSNELAGFGEATYRFTDQFWFTGGLRYGSVDAQGITEPGGYTSNYLARALAGLSGPLTITPVAAVVGRKAKGSKASYKLSLSYKPSDNLTTYATLSTGFRAPIVNARAGLASVVNPSDIIIPAGADSDNLKNYEIGAKGTFLDGKLTANLAAYIIDWKNIQVQANRVSDSVQFATNIGAARSKGIEFEIAARPAEGLQINLNGSINNAKVTELTAGEAAISGAVLGARLASPHFQGSATVKYDFDINADTEGFMTASIAHVGSYPGLFPRVPGNPNAIQSTYAFTEAFENVGMTAGAAWGDVKVTAYVENLFDNHEITYVHPEAFLASRFGTLIPRTFGIRFGYSL